MDLSQLEKELLTSSIIPYVKDNDQQMMDSNAVQEFNRSESEPSTQWKIFCHLLKYSVPTIAYYATVYAIYAIDLHFIGIYNDPMLIDAVGLGNSWLNCTNIAIITSLNMGLVTISSQSFGSRSYRLIGLYYHRALIINMIILLFDYVLLLFSHYFFYIFNIPEETSNIAAQYVIYNYGAIAAMTLGETTRGYLMAQEIFLPQVIVQVSCAILHWGWCVIFINWLDLRTVGIAIASTITGVLSTTILILYIFIKNPAPQSWFWFERASFKQLTRLLKYEIPIGSMVYLEWIAYEITLIFAGSYSPQQMGAQVTFFTVLEIVYNFPMGLSETLTTFSGNSIGERNPKKARKYFIMGNIIVWTFVLVMGLILYFFKDIIARFFTDDIEMIEEIKTICSLYILIMPADFNQSFYAGYIRGIGKEKIGSICFIISYYCIGLPLAFTFGNIMHLGPRGLWYGLGIGAWTMFLCCCIVIITTNLRSQIKDVSKRLRIDKEVLIMDEIEYNENRDISSIKETKVTIEKIYEENAEAEEEDNQKQPNELDNNTDSNYIVSNYQQDNNEEVYEDLEHSRSHSIS